MGGVAGSDARGVVAQMKPPPLLTWKERTDNYTNLYPGGETWETKDWEFHTRFRISGNNKYGGVWMVRGWDKKNEKSVELILKAKHMILREVEGVEIRPIRHKGMEFEEEVLKELEKLDAARRTHFLQFIQSGYEMRECEDEGSSASKALYRYIVTTRAGPSLDAIRKDFFGNLNFKPPEIPANIGLQLLEALRYLHKAGFVHQTIKPKHVAIKYLDPSVIILRNFECARRIEESNYKERMKLADYLKNTVMWNEEFCPRALHEDKEQGPKDDVESFIYLLIDLHRLNGLPWHSIGDEKGIHSIKNLTWTDIDHYLEAQEKANLNNGIWMPKVNPMVAHITKLKREELPNYDLLEKHLKAEYKAKGVNWANAKPLAEAMAIWLENERKYL